MNNFRNRILQLAGKIKEAQNVGRGDYYGSTNETIGDPERMPMGGDYGGSPSQPARPPIDFGDERKRRKQYPRFDFWIGFTSKDGPQGDSIGGSSADQPFAVGAGEGGSVTLGL